MPEKCKFERDEFDCLGMIIRQGRVRIHPKKADAILKVVDAPIKTRRATIPRVCQFLPPSRSRLRLHCSPFTSLDGHAAWQWVGSGSGTFITLKMAIFSAPLFTIPRDNVPYCVEADSSGYATGAVLESQEQDDGSWHLVASMSKSLSDVERNYDIHDREMLVIMRALDEWHHDPMGAPCAFEHLDRSLKSPMFPRCSQVQLPTNPMGPRARRIRFRINAPAGETAWQARCTLSPTRL